MVAAQPLPDARLLFWSTTPDGSLIVCLSINPRAEWEKEVQVNLRGMINCIVAGIARDI
jgi:hypothetical protein